MLDGHKGDHHVVGVSATCLLVHLWHHLVLLAGKQSVSLGEGLLRLGRHLASGQELGEVVKEAGLGVQKEHVVEHQNNVRVVFSFF